MAGDRWTDRGDRPGDFVRPLISGYEWNANTQVDRRWSVLQRTYRAVPAGDVLPLQDVPRCRRCRAPYTDQPEEELCPRCRPFPDRPWPRQWSPVRLRDDAPDLEDAYWPDEE